LAWNFARYLEFNQDAPSTPERPEMPRAWAELFGPLAKAIFSSIEFRTGIIRSNHAIQISTLRTEGAELLPPLSRKGGSLEERRDVSPRSLQDPFFKCLGLLHETYDLRTQLWLSHGLKSEEVRRVFPSDEPT
jgi:hypothetical protein